MFFNIYLNDDIYKEIFLYKCLNDLLFIKLEKLNWNRINNNIKFIEVIDLKFDIEYFFSVLILSWYGLVYFYNEICIINIEIVESKFIFNEFL